MHRCSGRDGTGKRALPTVCQWARGMRLPVVLRAAARNRSVWTSWKRKPLSA